MTSATSWIRTIPCVKPVRAPVVVPELLFGAVVVAEPFAAEPLAAGAEGMFVSALATEAGSPVDAGAELTGPRSVATISGA